MNDPTPFRPYAPGTQPAIRCAGLSRHAQAPSEAGAASDAAHHHRDDRTALLAAHISRRWRPHDDHG